MQNLLNDLIQLLEQDDRFVAEGKLLKNKIVESALALDSGLIKLLLKKEAIRKHFFVEIEGVLVFDKIRFQQFVSNKQFLPDSYTAFKNKIGLTSAGEYLTESKEVVLAWPYKDCMLEGGQTKEDAKRNEIFWNETLAPDQIDRLLSPKALTHFRKFDKYGEHRVSELSQNDNLIIKGNNLLALHTLKKVYAGKVKLIYIDPPFNTENDSFTYNDSFNHSTWLTFISNRLRAAKSLLAKDGIICVQLDENEAAYCRVLMNELFGRDNFRNEIIVRRGTKNVQSQFESIDSLSTGHDTIIIYSNSINTRLDKLMAISNEIAPGKWDTFWRGTDRPTMRYPLFGITPESGQWRWSEDRGAQAKKNYEEYVARYESEMSLDDYFGKIFQETGKEIDFVRLGPDGTVQYYVSPRNYKILADVWMDVSTSGRLTDFEHEKHEELLERIIRWLSRPSDIVLDFHLGSGTTAAVAHKMGRRYIGVEQMDYIENITVERLKKVIGRNVQKDGKMFEELEYDQGGISKTVNWQGGGSFVYCELNQANQTFIDRIQSAKTGDDLQTIWQAMQERAFLSYKLDPKTIDANKSEFEALSSEDQQRFLIEVLDKNMLCVPYSEIDDVTYAVSDEDKALNKQFFGLKEK